MTIRNDNRIEKKLDIDNINNVALLRKKMLATYAEEECGVKVRYYVEELQSGKNIYIERPTALNKGCDFKIYVEDLILCKNGNDYPPSHNDAIQDIVLKKERMYGYQYEELLQAITDIYCAKPFVNAIIRTKMLPQIGWDYDLLLKLLRWFFIEQDITYWSGEGRAMLYDVICNI